MPQMAPLSWLWLFFFICSFLMILNTFNYYSMLYFPKNIKLYKKIYPNWKW